ncbi:MAG TPA: 3-hydroxyacyl-CoA dehydrogenase NAD-binding domain-containing protein [Planctomycetaceae bacterium]|nr:3-hydroxyacyl-CoA dehydrogenase NAD-binding domain-containing protein [Planctomycetaceae bacterium]
MSDGTIQRVLIVGAGTMGQQIAVACRLAGLDVVLYDANPQALDVAHRDAERRAFGFQPNPVVVANRARILSQLRIVTDPCSAAAGIDLLIEAVPEKLPLKRDVFRQFHAVCPPETLFATNTSTLLPSQMAEATGRPAKFAAMHFNLERDLVEIMPHPGTVPETVRQLQAFCDRIGHVAIVCKREFPGFVFNNLLMMLNGTAIALAANGVASVEDIDRAWMQAMRMEIGPFGVMDGIGLDTAYRVTELRAQLTRDPQGLKNAQFLKQYVERGRLGIKSGAGFYEYPEPSYQKQQFPRVRRAA